MVILYYNQRRNENHYGKFKLRLMAEAALDEWVETFQVFKILSAVMELHF